MKRLLVILLVLTMVLGCVACKSNTGGKDSTSPPVTSSTPGNDDPNNGKDNESDKDKKPTNNRITSSKLDLYNSINDSNYLTVVLYDPLKERQINGDKDSFDKAILVTYDLEENFKDSFLNNKFSVVAERKNEPSLIYYFGLMSNKYVAYCCISTNILNDGIFNIALKEKEENGIYFYTNKTISSLSTIDKNYKNDYHIYSTNFKATDYSKLENKTSTDIINLKIGETSEKNIYVSMKLKESVNYGNSFITTVENYIKDNNFRNTLTILDNVDDLDSVNKIYGKEIKLSNTIFYQDIIATKISNDYGLNLRNKDFFIHLDTMYIKFRAYGEDNYLTEVVFDCSKEDEDYTFISTTIPDNKFSYKDKNDTQYEYFIDESVGQLYVFKNQEYVGKLKVTHKGGVSKNLYSDLNYIFGIK